MAIQAVLEEKLEQLILKIYGSVPNELASELAERLALSNDHEPSTGSELWSEKDVVLITYADQIRSSDRTALASLTKFLVDNDLPELIRCVHLLPFCPYSSDDGFSVIDYLAVDPDSGTWDDIADLGTHTDLMFDLVLNHCSQFNEWFQKFLAGDPEFADYFVTANPNDDLTGVTRPRSLPMLTEYASNDGPKHVWTTFSADQVDLNYGNPKVLLRMIDVLVEYAKRGARIIRLDAIAYLWKEAGSSCIHLPQTHAVVQLLRYMLDRLVPGTLILTETNVPHEENISYFGDGDEAHMVYQFSLPPLLLEAMSSSDTALLASWLGSLKPPYPQTNFFNFTASHDGVGVRPLEGLVSNDRILQLANKMRQRGGLVNTRRNADGTDSPYELNIAYVEATADKSQVSPQEHADRFLCTQAIMLSMQGMPAVYFHSLVGSPNDLEGVEKSGHNRRINRHKYDRDELDKVLADEEGRQRLIFEGYKELLKARIAQSAFHPDADQRTLDLPTDGLLGFVRTGKNDSIAVVANLTDGPREISSTVVGKDIKCDLLSPGERFTTAIPIGPYQVRWLKLDN